jgi:hypothetical protein
MYLKNKVLTCLFLLFVFNKFVFGKLKSCRDCVYYNANPKNLDYHSSLNTCNKFTKEFANKCRTNEDKCGEIGKEWKKEPNIMLKLFGFHFNKYRFINKHKNITEVLEINNKLLLEQKKTIHELIRTLRE